MRCGVIGSPPDSESGSPGSRPVTAAQAARPAPSWGSYLWAARASTVERLQPPWRNWQTRSLEVAVLRKERPGSRPGVGHGAAGAVVSGQTMDGHLRRWLARSPAALIRAALAQRGQEQPPCKRQAAGTRPASGSMGCQPMAGGRSLVPEMLVRAQPPQLRPASSWLAERRLGMAEAPGSTPGPGS